MTEPTQEELLNYISAAMAFYERIKGRGRAPTNKQIQTLLAACGVQVALKRINTKREIIRKLEQEGTPPGDGQPWNPDFRPLRSNGTEKYDKTMNKLYYS